MQTGAAPYAAYYPRNGLAVAGLVIGVASFVAALSFTLFALGLVGGLIGLILAIIAVARGRERNERGKAWTGLIFSLLALLIAVPLTIRVGTWAAQNSGAFTRFDNCVARAGDRVKIGACIGQFATEIQK
jgi:hypothetical protein